MNKLTKLRLLKAGMFVSGALTILIAMSNFIMNQYMKYTFKIDTLGKEAASMGIIGGADGPTAIFLVENQSFSYRYIWMVFFLLITVVCFSLWRKASRDS